MQLIASVDDNEQNWRHFGVVILHTLLSPAKSEFQPAVPSPRDAEAVSSHVLHAIEAAKTEVVSFLRDLALICQLLIPNIFCSNLGSQHDSHGDDSTIDIIKRYMTLFNMESHKIILESNLLQEILKSWYARSTGKITNQLDFPRVFHGTTWPVTPCVSELEIPTNSVHLLGNSFFATPSDNGLSPRIMYLPTSYTDLYATLSELYPDSEQTAVCLVCGQVRSRRACNVFIFMGPILTTFFASGIKCRRKRRMHKTYIQMRRWCGHLLSSSRMCWLNNSRAQGCIRPQPVC